MRKAHIRWLGTAVLTTVLAVGCLFPLEALATEDTQDARTITMTWEDGSEKEARIAGDFAYEIITYGDEEAARILAYTGGGDAMDIPEEIAGYPVTSLAIDPQDPGIEGVQYDQIKTLHFPESLTEVEARQLQYFEHLEEIAVAEGNDTFYVEDGILYQDRTVEAEDEDGETDLLTGRTLVRVPQTKQLKKFTIPDGIAAVDQAAFAGQGDLKEITLPASIVSVENAFGGCEKLQTINFTASEAPEEEDYAQFDGLRWYVTPETQINTPEDGSGYQDFSEWLKGKEQNAWQWDPAEGIRYRFPEGKEPQLRAYAALGEVFFRYSDSPEGDYGEEPLTDIGTHYAKAYVEETEEYNGLTSDPIEYEIIEPEENDNGETITFQVSVDADTWADHSEDLLAAEAPVYGSAEVMYQDTQADEDEAVWTGETPAEEGSYDYRVEMPGEEQDGETLGSLDIQEEDGQTVVRAVQQRWTLLQITCPDTVEGQTPQPEVESDDAESVAFHWFDAESEEELSEAPAEPGYYYVVAHAEETAQYEAAEDVAHFRIYSAEDAAAAEKVIDEIYELPDIITLKDADAVAAARTSYDALTQDQQAIIGYAVDELESAEVAIKCLRMGIPVRDAKAGEARETEDESSDLGVDEAEDAAGDAEGGAGAPDEAAEETPPGDSQ